MNTPQKISLEQLLASSAGKKWQEFMWGPDVGLEQINDQSASSGSSSGSGASRSISTPSTSDRM